MSTVSVIVVSHNSRRYLPACLRAITAQLAATDELIVVDNGSTDGSAELVATQFPAARLLRGPNLGFAAGNNRGAAAARGTSLVFLNPDTMAHPGAIAALVAALAEPGVGMCTACVVLAGRPDTVNACGNSTHYTGLTYCRGANRPRTELREATDVSAVSGAAFAISRTLFAALGGFDERFFLYVEDSDLSWRARMAGWRIRYVPAALVEHAYGMRMSPRKAYYLERNRHLMLLKNLERTTYLRMLPALLLSELVTGGYLLLRGPRFWGAKPRAYRWLWRNRRAVAAAHRESQARRRVPDSAVLRATEERLDLAQLAPRPLAALAGLLLHPLYRLARPLRQEARPC